MHLLSSCFKITHPFESKKLLGAFFCSSLLALRHWSVRIISKSASNSEELKAEGLLAGEASSIACLKMSYFFFLAPVSDFIFEVSADILFIVSGAGVAGAVVSGATVDVLSFVSELLPLLLQAAKDAAIIAIAKNFFICRILRIVNNRFGVYTLARQKVTRDPQKFFYPP